jgi:site-specific recombinase XerC
MAIIRMFLNADMRLEGMVVPRNDASDPDLSDVDVRGGVVRVTVKGRREMVLPIGKKTALDVYRYLRMRAAFTGRRPVAVAAHEGPSHGEQDPPEIKDRGKGLACPTCTRTSCGTRSRTAG